MIAFQAYLPWCAVVVIEEELNDFSTVRAAVDIIAEED